MKKEQFTDKETVRNEVFNQLGYRGIDVDEHIEKGVDEALDQLDWLEDFLLKQYEAILKRVPGFLRFFVKRFDGFIEDRIKKIDDTIKQFVANTLAKVIGRINERENG